MTDVNLSNREAIPIAAFNSTFKLVAIFKSFKEASSVTGIVRQSIIKAAHGEIISVNKKYWRMVPEDIILDIDDLGKLTLFDFDRVLGEDRKIYATRNMRRNEIIQESIYIKKHHL